MDFWPAVVVMRAIQLGDSTLDELQAFTQELTFFVDKAQQYQRRSRENVLAADWGRNSGAMAQATLEPDPDADQDAVSGKVSTLVSVASSHLQPDLNEDQDALSVASSQLKPDPDADQAALSLASSHLPRPVQTTPSRPISTERTVTTTSSNSVVVTRSSSFVKPRAVRSRRKSSESKAKHKSSLRTGAKPSKKKAKPERKKGGNQRKREFIKNPSVIGIGTRVRKFFSGYGEFIGEVVEVDEKRKWHKVKYADGDAEDLNPEEVIRYAAFYDATDLAPGVVDSHGFYYSACAGETPKTIAEKVGCKADRIVDINFDRLSKSGRELLNNSRIYEHTKLCLPSDCDQDKLKALMLNF